MSIAVDSVKLSDLIREVFLFSGVYRGNSQLVNVQMIATCEALRHYWDIYITSFLPRLRDHCGRRSRKTARSRGGGGLRQP